MWFDRCRHWVCFAAVMNDPHTDWCCDPTNVNDCKSPSSRSVLSHRLIFSLSCSRLCLYMCGGGNDQPSVSLSHQITLWKEEWSRMRRSHRNNTAVLAFSCGTYTLIQTHTHTYTHKHIHSYTLKYSHKQTHTLTNSHSYSNIQTLTYIHILTHSHTHILRLTQTLTYSNTHIHTHTNTQTHTHWHTRTQILNTNTYAHALTYSNTHSNTHTNTQTHTHKLSDSHTQILTQTLTHKHSYSVTYTQSYSHLYSHTYTFTLTLCLYFLVFWRCSSQSFSVQLHVSQCSMISWRSARVKLSSSRVLKHTRSASLFR